MGDPTHVVKTFEFIDKTGFSLSSVARLDTIVTVCDVTAVLKHLRSPAKLQSWCVASSFFLVQPRLLSTPSLP